MSTDKMRKSFQEWANAHYLLSELNCAIEDGEYEEPEMQYSWEAWQASRAASEVELPKSANANNAEVIKAVGRHIIAQGLKVKP